MIVGVQATVACGFKASSVRVRERERGEESHRNVAHEYVAQSYAPGSNRSNGGVPTDSGDGGMSSARSWNAHYIRECV